MQISSINSTNFGAGKTSNSRRGYYSSMTNEDIREIEKINNALKEYRFSHETKSAVDGEKPNKKGIIGTILSIGVASVAIFAMTKKGLKSTAEVLSNAANNIAKKPAVQNVLESAKNFVQTNKITSNVLGALSKAKDKILNNPVGDFAKKLGTSNIFAGAVTLGATARILKEDGNNNGIPDIMERGINAYKSILKEADLAKQVVDTLS